ncbi:MAG: hypothetical protein H0T76_12235 [Nannocystis sp.]|nr:hypothetical protein [Nannocystis sp.]MBA3547246.1 hypothetical protein [Nannocystis sp.]
MNMREHTVTIGLEFRCRLATRTRLFSPCAMAMSAAPDSQVDAYTLALPGTLPALNRQAVELAIRLALALGAAIAPVSRWVRRHAFDPSLPKGYQTTQGEAPLARGGTIEVAGRALRLTSIRLAEHAGELRNGSVDFSRAGAPLLELAGESMIMRAAPEEASAYLRALQAIVRATGVADSDMPGALRCDAHVSLWPKGQEGSGARCTVADLGSGPALERAIAAEIQRQAALLDQGLVVASMTPEANHLYLPEPDLPPLRIDAAWIERARAGLPDPLR